MKPVRRLGPLELVAPKHLTETIFFEDFVNGSCALDYLRPDVELWCFENLEAFTAIHGEITSMVRWTITEPGEDYGKQFDEDCTLDYVVMTFSNERDMTLFKLFWM